MESSFLMVVTTVVLTFMVLGTGVTGLKRDNDLVEELDLTLSVGELRPLLQTRMGRSPGSEQNELFRERGFRGDLKKSSLGAADSLERESLWRDRDLAEAVLLLLEMFLSKELSLEWKPVLPEEKLLLFF